MRIPISLLNERRRARLGKLQTQRIADPSSGGSAMVGSRRISSGSEGHGNDVYLSSHSLALSSQEELALVGLPLSDYSVVGP